MQLQSYSAGRWVSGTGKAATLRDASTGEVIASANDELTEQVLAKLREAGITRVQTIYTNDLDQGGYISQTLRIDETADQTAAQVAIYRMLRPGEPPTRESAQALLENLFFKDKRYDLAKVGRYKANKKLGLEVEKSTGTLTE